MPPARSVAFHNSASNGEAWDWEGFESSCKERPAPDLVPQGIEVRGRHPTIEHVTIKPAQRIADSERLDPPLGRRNIALLNE
jgi:hypothetical protein